MEDYYLSYRTNPPAADEIRYPAVIPFAWIPDIPTSSEFRNDDMGSKT
jgi:hypothetical protein